MGQSLKITQTITLSFVIFAIFFGAGNLIFPPIVGFQSGENFFLAVIGFLIIAVGLPTLSTIAFASLEGNVSLVTDKINKKFTLCFTSLIYLLIGPIFAVPRTAIVSNEMSMVPFIPEHIGTPNLILFIFTFVYFLSIYLFCIYSSKVIEIVSKYVMPILLGIVLILIAGSIIWPISTPGLPIGDYSSHPLITGMLDGFLTMDSLGTFIIVAIVIARLKEMGITESSAIIKYTMKSGIIAGISLSIVYFGLAYIGVTSDVDASTTNGGVILVRSAMNSFGFAGKALLALSVFIACFTTALTLLIGFARYFNQIVPSISYKNFLRFGVIFSFIVSNLGFDTLMAVTVPVLNIMYPLTIVIVFFTLLRNHINETTSRCGIVTCLVVSIAFVAYTILLDYFDIAITFLTIIPLFEKGLGWLIPTFIVILISYLITGKSKETIN